MRHLVISLILISLLAACAPPPDERPNIVVILADDMGYSDIAPYGGEIDTPNLTRLSDGGVRFTQFYNSARCCPTRAALLTGLHPQRAGVGHMVYDAGYTGYRGDLSEETATIAEVLGAAGYGTYMSGKWHVTKQMGEWSGVDSLTSRHNWPMQRGFDRFFGTILGAGSFYDPITLTSGNTPLTRVSDDFYYTDAISDTAVSYVEEHNSQSDAPFFMYVAYTAPHWPLHARPEDIARYDGIYDAGWDAIRESRLTRMKEMGLIEASWKLTPRDPRAPAWAEIAEEEKIWYSRAMEVYAAQVEVMDRGIGRILDALEAAGEIDNTLIFFLADNGGCAEVLSGGWSGLFLPETTRDGRPVTIGNEFRDQLPGPEDTYMSYGIGWANASNTPFRLYKHWVHEGGISTPLIAHWPAGIEAAGTFVREPGHIIDLMATAVDVASASYPADKAPLAGKSLRPVFGSEPIERDALFWEHEGNRAVRMGNWKLVARHNQPWELYDLDADRSETNDLADQYPERVAEMTRAYDIWAEQNDVQPWPL